MYIQVPPPEILRARRTLRPLDLNICALFLFATEGALVTRFQVTVLLDMPELPALFALGLVKVAALTSIMAVPAAVIAVLLLTRGTILIGRAVVAVRVRARAVVSVSVAIFRGGRLLLSMGLVSLVLLFDQPYQSLAVNVPVWVPVGLIDTALDIRPSELIPRTRERGRDDALEEHVVQKLVLFAKDVDLVPGLLELHEVVQNVGALSSPSLKDNAKLLSIVLLRRGLEHALQGLPHFVSGGTALSMNVELVGDIVGDAHLGTGVVVLPRTSPRGILSRIGAWKSAIDVVLDVNHLDQVIHETRPGSPVAGFGVKGFFHFGTGRATRNGNASNSRCGGRHLRLSIGRHRSPRVA